MEFLQHDVYRKIYMVIVLTDSGDELIGIPSQPILENGEWMEMKDTLSVGLFQNARMESLYKEVLYNLEVNVQESLGTSQHTFHVHGITASGLCVLITLNQLYRLQKS